MGEAKEAQRLPEPTNHTAHCLSRMEHGDGECECEGRGLRPARTVLVTHDVVPEGAAFVDHSGLGDGVDARPPIDGKCPKCGAETTGGYGLMGGGVGPYDFCEAGSCDYFHKTLDEDEG
jgi:hypothetical protein